MNIEDFQNNDIEENRNIDLDFFYNDNDKMHHDEKCIERDKLSKTYVTEIPKIAEIRDVFHNLWYKVILEEDEKWKFIQHISRYRVKVIYFRYDCTHPEPLVIVDRPDKHEAPLIHYEQARALFDEYVKQYSTLVKSHMNDVKDIDIYSEKIGYKLTCPACCYTCKYCRKSDDIREKQIHDHEFAFEKDYIIGITGNLECIHPLNQKEPILGMFDNDRNHNGHDPKVHHYDPHFDPVYHEYPYCHPNNHHDFKMLHPKVSILGVCENYVKMPQVQYNPIPGDSIQEIIDNKVTKRMKPIVADEVFHAMTSPNLSVVLNPAIAASIPTTQVSSNIISVVAQGISVEKIIGNDGLSTQVDLNNNGIDDFYEDNSTVIGNLGA